MKDAARYDSVIGGMRAVVSAVEGLRDATAVQSHAWQRELGPVLAAREAFLALGLPEAEGGALADATDLIDTLELEAKARAALDAAIAARVSDLLVLIVCFLSCAYLC